MPKPRRAVISSRKVPQQARSTELVSAVLEAAVRVLAKEGAARFTTARVAHRAGVSVGSVYQYFPNKASILFRLQADEWQQTTDLLRAILEDASRPPLERVRTLVHAFIRSECEEASVRVALSDAAPLYRDAPEAKAARAKGERAFRQFMNEALPDASPATRATASHLFGSTISALGKEFSASPRSPAEIEKYSGAVADMLCAYIASLAKR